MLVMTHFLLFFLSLGSNPELKMIHDIIEDADIANLVWALGSSTNTDAGYPLYFSKKLDRGFVGVHPSMYASVKYDISKTKEGYVYEYSDTMAENCDVLISWWQKHHPDALEEKRLEVLITTYNGGIAGRRKSQEPYVQRVMWFYELAKLMRETVYEND